MQNFCPKMTTSKPNQTMHQKLQHNLQSPTNFKKGINSEKNWQNIILDNKNYIFLSLNQ